MGLTVYHLSSDLDNIIEEFIPRIPSKEVMGYLENDEIPRICVSTSLAGAITAKPRDPRDKILGQTFRVYVFDIDYPDDPDFMLYRTLYEKEYVIDSLLTKECWLLKKMKPVKTHLIKITKISQELVPVIQLSKLKDYLYQLENDPDNSDNWLDKNGGHLEAGFDKINWIDLETNEPGYDYNSIHDFWTYKNK